MAYEKVYNMSFGKVYPLLAVSYTHLGIGIDFLVSSANKCVQGVPGFSMVTHWSYRSSDRLLLFPSQAARVVLLQMI